MLFGPTLEFSSQAFFAVLNVEMTQQVHRQGLFVSMSMEKICNQKHFTGYGCLQAGRSC